MSAAHLSVQIEQSIQKGQFARALKAINQFKKLGLSNETRFQCSLWFFRIGFPEKSLHILTSELPDEILEQADFYSLRLQARLAFVLSYLGAKNYALRILKRLQPFLKKRVEFQKNFGSSFYSYFANAYLRIYDYQNAHDYYQKALEVIDQNTAPYVYLTTCIPFAYSLEALGKTEEALALTQKTLAAAQEQQVFFKAICNLALGEFFLRSNQLIQADTHFKIAENLFGTDNTSLDYGFLKKWQGIWHFIHKNYEQSAADLAIAYQILNKKSLNPAVVLEVLFWLNQVNKFYSLKINLPLAVAKTHPSRNPYSVLLGRKFEPSDLPLHPWILAQNKKSGRSNLDTWVFYQNQVQATEYKCTIIKNEPGVIIDLVSGVITHHPKNDRPHFSFLSDLKIKCLMFVLGCGEMGANFWALADFLYPHDQCDLDYVQMRIKELLKHLRRSGFELVFKQQKIFWLLQKDVTVCVPMNYELKGVIAHFCCFYPTFTRKDLELFYQIPNRTASNWLQKWNDGNLLEVVNQEAVPYYQLKSNS